MSTDEFQTAKAIHTFSEPGEHTIVETIHTDDLQTPEVKVETHLKVTGNALTEAVKITAQPVAQEVKEGETATFTAAASGMPAPTVQWQVSTNEGTSWANVPVGGTTDILKVEGTTLSENDHEYRAVFTNSSGSKETEAAKLTVEEIKEAVQITTQPIAQVVEEGKTATFTAAASGMPAPTVQWQLSTDTGKTWTNDTTDAGSTTDTLTVTSTTLAESGHEYRAVFTNSSGPVDTQAAELTVKTVGVKEAVEITTQPAAQVVEAGKTATFTAAASGLPAPTVQWEVSTDSGADWAPDTTDAGNTTDTLSVAGTTLAENGYEYRAVFTNSSGFKETEPAKLTVEEIKEAIEIATQPTAQVVEAGKTATFTAAASGIPAPTVQWEVSADGGATWSEDMFDAGNTTDTLSVAGTTLAEDDYEYRAVFTNSSGPVDTDAAKLTVTAHEVGKTKETEKLKEPIVTPKEPTPNPIEPVLLPKGTTATSPGVAGIFGGQTPAGAAAGPDAELSSTSLETSGSGAIAIVVACPAGASDCTGTVTLRTLGAVPARAAGKGKKKRKAAVLTLAAGAFTVAGGQVETVTLHLSAKALALLARSHVLQAQATIVAHDVEGAAHTTETTVTLHAAKAKHGHR